MNLQVTPSLVSSQTFLEGRIWIQNENVGGIIRNKLVEIQEEQVQSAATERKNRGLNTNWEVTS